MFEFKEVSKSFKGDILKGAKEFLALDKLSFEVQEGSLTGFLGANGAGKTTSLKCLFNFINIDSGEIKYSEQLGADWGQIKSHIGYVPERPYFYPHLSGREFVFLCGELNDVSHKHIVQKIEEWAERLGIAFALNRRLKDYSKGMLQRLGVLTALVHDPKLIVLDEPLSGLDPLGRLELKKAFVDLQKLGKTIFFSSHIVSDVEEVSDRVVVIDGGKLVYAGSTSDIVNRNEDNSYLLFCLSQENKVPDELEEFVSRKVNGGVYFEVPGESIEKIVSQVSQSHLSLQKLEKKKISLEEFVYHTGQN